MLNLELDFSSVERVPERGGQKIIVSPVFNHLIEQYDLKPGEPVHFTSPEDALRSAIIDHNPFFPEGTGLESYFLGQGLTSKEVFESYLKIGKRIQQTIDFEYKNRHHLKSAATNPTDLSHIPGEIYQFWRGVAQATMARLKAFPLGNPKAEEHIDQLMRGVRDGGSSMVLPEGGEQNVKIIHNYSLYGSGGSFNFPDQKVDLQAMIATLPPKEQQSIKLFTQKLPLFLNGPVIGGIKVAPQGETNYP